MVNITYLKKLDQDIKTFCQEYAIGLELPLEIFSLILKRYFVHCEKKGYTDQIDLIENYPLISPTTIIKEVKEWTDKMKLEGKTAEDFYGTFKSQKRIINGLLLTMWFKGKDKGYNELNVRLKKGALRFAYNQDDQKKAEAAFNRITKDKPKKRKKANAANRKSLPAVDLYTAEQLLNARLQKWKESDYLGELALPLPDLVKVGKGLKDNHLDQESLAYIFISSVFRRHQYYLWWPKNQENPLAIWHLINLLTQLYRRPYWRAAYLLQYADPALLSKVISEFPQEVLEDKQIKGIIKNIKSRTVKEYLRECIERNDFLVEPYGTQLLREFKVLEKGIILGEGSL